jgi:hypothetical protein
MACSGFFGPAQFRIGTWAEAAEKARRGQAGLQGLAVRAAGEGFQAIDNERKLIPDESVR